MRICLIGPTYPFRGGIAHYTTILAQQLRQHGHDVCLYSFSRGYPTWLYPGQTDRDPSQRPLHTPITHLINPWNPRSWLQATHQIQASQPDAVIIEWWVPYWAPLQITLAVRLRRAGLPVFMDCQNILPHEWHPLAHTLTRLTLRQATACMVYSNTHQQELQALVPHIPSVLVPFPPYTPLGQTTIAQEEARRQLGLVGHVALFFGFVRPYKGLPILLEALARSAVPVHLLIVGEFWQNQHDYEKQIQALDLNGQVTLINRYVPDEELPLYFAAADVLVLPYIAPIQSGVLALAQAFQIPVIASDLGGLAEGIIPGQTGLLVAPNDVPALAAAIGRFFRENLRQVMLPYLHTHQTHQRWERVITAWVDLTTAVPPPSRIPTPP